jgi:hypothetical protein
MPARGERIDHRRHHPRDLFEGAFSGRDMVGCEHSARHPPAAAAPPSEGQRVTLSSAASIFFTAAFEMGRSGHHRPQPDADDFPCWLIKLVNSSEPRREASSAGDANDNTRYTVFLESTPPSSSPPHVRPACRLDPARHSRRLALNPNQSIEMAIDYSGQTLLARTEHRGRAV